MNLRPPLLTHRPAAIRRPILFVAAALAIVAGSYTWAGLRLAIQPARPAALVAAPLAAPGGSDPGAAPQGVDGGSVDASGLDGVSGGVVDPAALPGSDGRRSLNDRIAFWAGRVKRTPNDFPSLVQLALAEASKARLTADLGLYDQARRQLEQALTLDPNHGPTLRAIAQVRFALHDFAGAVEAGRAALERMPHDDGALSILGDALLELGRIDEARTTYGAISTAAAGPAVDARYARLDLLTGKVDDAVGLARRAYDAAVVARGEDVVFYAYQLGETARQAGDSALARTGFEAALALRPTDLGSLVGLARVDAAAGRTDAALAGLRHAAEIAPQPDTLALLGDLLAERGDSVGAAAQYRTVRAIAKLSALAGSVYDRQLVLFELDHGGATQALLDHARAGLAARPDGTGHDVVAWALYRLGRFGDALTESRLALATGTRDARIVAHAGAIELALGDQLAGQRDLRAALALGPGLDPLTTDQAIRLLAGS